MADREAQQANMVRRLRAMFNAAAAAKRGEADALVAASKSRAMNAAGKVGAASRNIARITAAAQLEENEPLYKSNSVLRSTANEFVPGAGRGGARRRRPSKKTRKMMKRRRRLTKRK